MQPDVALEEIFKELYPFSEIVGNANILIMPGLHASAISFKIIKSMSRAKVIGPLLIGLAQPIEIAPLRTSTSEILIWHLLQLILLKLLIIKNNLVFLNS